MRPAYNRKTSPKVIGGLVQRKNNHVKTATLGYVVDRFRPGRGFMHVLTKKDIHDFTDLISDWPKIAVGIEAIYLDSESEYSDGYYRHYYREGTGVIWLCAWQKDLWVEYSNEYFQEHLWLFKALGVTYEKTKENKDNTKIEAHNNTENADVFWTCYFTIEQAKAFMLMHVFLHELGHHVDKLRSKKRDTMKGGETFAERYANRRFRELWPAYVGRFGNTCLSK